MTNPPQDNKCQQCNKQIRRKAKESTVRWLARSFCSDTCFNEDAAKRAREGDLSRRVLMTLAAKIIGPGECLHCYRRTESVMPLDGNWKNLVITNLDNLCTDCHRQRKKISRGICVWKDCRWKSIARGLCRTHYHEARKRHIIHKFKVQS